MKTPFAPATLLLLLASLASAPAGLSAAAFDEVSTAAPSPGGIPLPASLTQAASLTRELEALRNSAMPASEITAIAAESKTPWAPRADGAWRVDGISQVPARDTLTLKVKIPRGGGRQLQIAFPTDPALVSNGPGLAGNGNAVIGQIEVFRQGRKLHPKIIASASQSNGGRTADKAFDGPKQVGDARWSTDASGWELGAGKEASATLDLGENIPGDAELTLRIGAQSKWETHIPGTFRCAVVPASGATAAPKQGACEIVSIVSENKIPFALKNDRTLAVAKLAPNPATDTLTLTLKPAHAGQILRLDFPTDDSLPGGGPGRVSNGNAVISEIAVTQDGKALKPESIWGSVDLGGNYSPSATIDGGSAKSLEGWNLNGGKHQRRTLLITLREPAAAGTDLTVKIICKSKWSQYTPGCVSAALVGGDQAVKQSAQLKAARRDFDNWLAQTAAALDGDLSRPGGAQALAAHPAGQSALAQAELLRVCGPEKVWQVASKTDGAAFLRAFLADRPWLESFLLGGAEGTLRADYGQALDNLRVLHGHVDRAVWNDPVSRNTATALALEAGAMNRYRLLQRFNLIEQARTDGLLHAGFDTLGVCTMRHAMNVGDTPMVDSLGPTNAFQYRGWLEERQQTIGEYTGACWAVAYTKSGNPYNYWLGEWGYYGIFNHAYPMAVSYRTVGAICGGESRYGSACALTHGVPSFPVGQPGHCAYVVGYGDDTNWAMGNVECGPETNSWSAYEGLCFVSTDQLLGKIQNAPEYLGAQRLAWAARLQRAAGKSAALWRPSHEACLAAQPLNYAAWLEYVKALEADAKEMTPDAWNTLGLRAADAFKNYQEAGWALFMRCCKNGQAQVATPADRAELLLKCHRILNQKFAPAMCAYNIYPSLDAQADLIADPAVAVDFFEKLLTIHYSEKPALNWVFGCVMNWGTARFAKDPATSAARIKALGNFFAAQGDQADQVRMTTLFAQGIRQSSVAGDTGAYHLWTALAQKLLPPGKVESVFLDAPTLAKMPRIEPFPGMLVSKDAVFSSSSACGFDRPLSYAQALEDTGMGGWLHTNLEIAPWMQIELPGETELNGVILLPRYEYPKTDACRTAYLPLKLSVSNDGKTWVEVGRFDKADDVLRMDLQATKNHARFVRIERVPSADGKPADLQFRKFTVYGRKLY